MDFIAKAYADFWTLTPTAQISFLVGLTGLSVFSGIAGSLLQLGRLKSWRSIAEQRQSENVKLTSERDSALALVKQERAASAAWQPALWMASARRERTQGNEERAIAMIEEGFERVHADLADCAVALAGHHLTLVIGPDPSEHLEQGRRFARLACDLNTSDQDAAFLLEEADMLSAQGSEMPDAMPASFIPRDTDEAMAVINATVGFAEKLFSEGAYRLALRLYRRAELIIARSGLLHTEIGMDVSFYASKALFFAGRYDEALSKTIALLPIRKRVSGTEHPETLIILHLEASILVRLGKIYHALEKVASLLPILERVSGADHAFTLATRYLEVNLLIHLDEHRQAFDKVVALIGAHERLSEADPSAMLATRYLQADILNNLGEHRQAFDKVVVLMAMQERVGGAEHPDALTNRYLEAKILDRLGRHREALDKVSVLLPIRGRVSGPTHPDTLATRYLEAEILNRSGEHRLAFDKLAVLMPIQEEVSGADHPHTLTSRRVLAETLIGISDFSAALVEIDTTLPLQSGEQRLVSELVRARIWSLLGEPERAAAALDDIIALYETWAAPTHWRLCEAKRLRATLEKH